MYKIKAALLYLGYPVVRKVSSSYESCFASVVAGAPSGLAASVSMQIVHCFLEKTPHPVITSVRVLLPIMRYVVRAVCCVATPSRSINKCLKNGEIAAGCRSPGAAPAAATSWAGSSLHRRLGHQGIAETAKPAFPSALLPGCAAPETGFGVNGGSG